MNISQAKARLRAGTLTKPDFIRECLAHHQTLFDYIDVARNTDVKEIRIAGDGVSFIIGDQNIRIYCPPGEERVAPIEIMNFGSYEPEESRVMDALSEDSRCILDIGANIGWHSIRFAKRLLAARVFAFEPIPTSHAYLQLNVACNDMATRITTFNYGLSDANGSFDFFIPPTNSANASLENVSDAHDARRIVGLTLTLDQWVANYRVQPDFIKCDVEGAELLVFRGGLNTLTEHRPIVFTELLRKWSKPFGYHPNDMISYFDELGYLCFAVGAAGVRRINSVTDETKETNYSFLHGKNHAHLISMLDERS